MEITAALAMLSLSLVAGPTCACYSDSVNVGDVESHENHRANVIVAYCPSL